MSTASDNGSHAELLQEVRRWLVSTANGHLTLHKNQNRIKLEQSKFRSFVIDEGS